MSVLYFYHGLMKQNPKKEWAQLPVVCYDDGALKKKKEQKTATSNWPLLVPYEFSFKDLETVMGRQSRGTQH